MFENTLLIIKSDFMPRRKCLLLHILSRGFQIQGNRKLAFTPEDAAEFNKDLADDKCYMLYVILLSKGTSEAFILTKENAVTELLNNMVCYFGTSVEMDRNVHVSRSIAAAQREITFIFPNYIHEPIVSFDKHRFCKQSLMPPFFSEIFNISKAPCKMPDGNWRSQLSDWLLKTNSSLPHISNQCSLRPDIGIQEKAQQTESHAKGLDELVSPCTSGVPSLGSSGLITSSSCISCTSFKRDRSSDAFRPNVDAFEAHLLTCATKTMKEDVKEDKPDLGPIPDDYIEYGHVYEYEDGQMDDETDDETRRRNEMEIDEGEGEKPFNIASWETVNAEEAALMIMEEEEKRFEEPIIETQAMGDVSEQPSVLVAAEEEKVEDVVPEPIESAAEPAPQAEPAVEEAPEPAAEPVAEPEAVPEGEGDGPPAAEEPAGEEPAAEEPAAPEEAPAGGDEPPAEE